MNDGWLHDTLRESLRDPDSPHRLVTVCSGTLLAARAGLLDTRRCTTHHELLHALRALAPNALVIDDRVFITALAAVGNTVERHLLRLFIDHAGISPLEYVRSIRLERARQSLEYGATVTRAAEVAGFSSGLQLRRAWQR